LAEIYFFVVLIDLKGVFSLSVFAEVIDKISRRIGYWTLEPFRHYSEMFTVWSKL